MLLFCGAKADGALVRSKGRSNTKKKIFNLYFFFTQGFDYTITTNTQPKKNTQFFKMEYYSDASYDSDEEVEEEEIEIYTQRELDYMELEKLLECRGAPPVIEYCKKIGVVTLRCDVLDLKTMKIENVVDPLTVHSWNNYWKKRPIDKKALFDSEDWNAIGEFAYTLCIACGFDHPHISHVKNVMLNLLSHVNFKHPTN